MNRTPGKTGRKDLTQRERRVATRPAPRLTEEGNIAIHNIKRTITPARLTDVTIDDSFWRPRIDTNVRTSIPAQYEACRKTGRLAALDLSDKTIRRHLFWDSDVAKWLEAASHSLATRQDAELRRRIDHVAGLFKAAQEPDGYLDSYITAVEPGRRWTNLQWNHELYSAGHFIEAAIAHRAATGRSDLLEAALRLAGHIARTFGRGRGKIRGYGGHPEIELALVKLYRATRDRHWLELAAYFVNERGTQPNFFEREAKQVSPNLLCVRGTATSGLAHGQAHAPLREQTEAVGHAVCAAYLFAGAADVAAETGDVELLRTCRRLWRSITERRMYVTGGIGSDPRWERFTFDYDLPNERAYAESCAAVALVFLAHRMLNIERHGRYADVMERALYNGVLSGVSLDGRHYFYQNRLAALPDALQRLPDTYKHPLERQEWYGCACCPSNISRLLASLGSYVYGATPRQLWVHLYVGGKATVRLGSATVRLQQNTDYPWDGTVRLCLGLDASAAFTLALRIPGWCRAPELDINGARQPLQVSKGYAKLRRRWRDGDVVKLSLPMPVERVYAHPDVRHDRDRLALQRGPIVYCLEEADNGKGLNRLLLPSDARLRLARGPRALGAPPVIQAQGLIEQNADWQGRLYRHAPPATRPARLTAVPYCLWANRKLGEMLVWIRERKTGA